MSDFEEAKTKLKGLLEELGLVLADEHERELYVKLTKSDSSMIVIPEQEITEFQTFLATLPTITNIPVETSIVGPDFREQLVEQIGTRTRFLPILPRDAPIKFQPQEGEGFSVEISAASPIFSNYFRFRKERKSFFVDRMSRVFIPGRTPTIQDIMPRMLTIKIKYDVPQDVSHLVNLNGMLESCLFELSYMTNIHIELRNEWPVGPTRRQVSRRRASPRSPLPLRRVTYENSVVKFYQRGVATDDAYIQFVSFYHILEFYFITVSDSILYSRLSRVIHDPTFRATPKHLDKLIAATDEHKRVNDETEMLKNVLNTYVDEKDVIDFISAHEDTTKEKIFTEKNECFGHELDKLTLREGHVLGPIAKRIKTIRNALVHSSDRYDRKDRYIPGLEADRVLQREVPLLKFIAERVIVATARPSEWQ